ncbi:hypothetical protein M8C13_35815 [Crossiella sp. SN42]|uniref:hypothetical protein n=1 Tax=Crossiella sp. SN42 TaxID=2944808 RepID=UPI00207C81AD|nr:hypothetical protein [Crossiella sp. SN42]MCO1581133.1 hypothetical protein [Crossiella sp. SN42]
MAKSGAQRARNLLVWLHVLSSVGWLALALTLCVLISYGIGAEPGLRLAAFRMAEVLDVQLLQILGETSAFTGFMLSALTSWGYFRHWWVLTKFVITLAQLYVGIFILSGNLHESVRAAEAGGIGPAVWLAVASALMAGGFAFQAWLSVAKPGKRTPWTPPGKLPAAPVSHVYAASAVPVLAFALGLFLPWVTPLLMLGVVLWYSARRGVKLRVAAG